MNSQEKTGKNIRKIRKNLRLTQAQVAKKASINSNYYSRIERGEVNPSYEMLESIVKALKVKSSDIIAF